MYQLDETGLFAGVVGKEIVRPKKNNIKHLPPEIEALEPEVFRRLELPEEVDMLATFYQWVGKRVSEGGGYRELSPEELASRPLLLAKQNP